MSGASAAGRRDAARGWVDGPRCDQPWVRRPDAADPDRGVGPAGVFAGAAVRLGAAAPGPAWENEVVVISRRGPGAEVQRDAQLAVQRGFLEFAGQELEAVGSARAESAATDAEAARCPGRWWPDAGAAQSARPVESPAAARRDAERQAKRRQAADSRVKVDVVPKEPGRDAARPLEEPAEWGAAEEERDARAPRKGAQQPETRPREVATQAGVGPAARPGAPVQPAAGSACLGRELAGESAERAVYCPPRQSCLPEGAPARQRRGPPRTFARVQRRLRPVPAAGRVFGARRVAAPLRRQQALPRRALRPPRRRRWDASRRSASHWYGAGAHTIRPCNTCAADRLCRRRSSWSG